MLLVPAELEAFAKISAQSPGGNYQMLVPAEAEGVI
jgi:hypothetical protein